MPESARDAAQAVSEYVKGVDKATALRRAFAAWLAVIMVVGMLPPTIVYLGGPDLRPVELASAEPHNLSTATLDGTLSLGWTPDSVDIAKDGEKLYVVEVGSPSTIHEYTLSTPYDVTTATEENTFDTKLNGIDVADNGTRLYTVTFSGTAKQWDLTEAYNISTATNVKSESTHLSDNTAGISIGKNGEKVYIGDEDGEDVVEYNLTTAWDITTMTSSVNRISVGETNIDGVFMADNGTDFYVGMTDSINDDAFVEHYDLTTKWDLGTASLADTLDLGDDQHGVGMGGTNSGEWVYVTRSDTNNLEGYNMETETQFDVSGTVNASDGTALEDVSISVNSTGDTATTDANGDYNLNLPNGTYKITASKSGFDDNSTTVTVNGSDETGVDLTLFEEADLFLEVPSHMYQNQTEDYTVFDQSGGSDTDVTDNATVTSSDPTNLTVHESNNTLESTSNLQFNGEIEITATYEGKTVTKNVTVANMSADNVDLMQHIADMTLALWGDPIHPETGDRQGGTQLTMRVLFIAVLLGAAIVPLASAFAGIGMTTLVVAMGWFMGWVGDGMALVTVFTGLFIGLNVAANIDYSVRR